MRSKIYALLSLFLMTVLGTVTSFADVGTVLTALDQISSSKCYTITTKRGALVLNSEKTGVVSAKKSTGTVDNTAASTETGADQWVIVSAGDAGYYLYNVNNGKVLNSDGSMSNYLSEALELMLASTGSGDYVFKIRKGNTTLNNNNQGGFYLDDWNDEDDGNKLSIVEAADFSAVDFTNLPSYTYNVVDESGNVVASEKFSGCFPGQSYTSTLGNYTGVTLTTPSFTASSESGTVSSTYTFDESTYPFKLSKSVSDASWYMIKINRDTPKYSSSDGTYANNSTSLTETSFSSATAFCFVGTPFGFNLVNHATPNKAFGPKTSTNNGILTNGDVADAASFVFEKNGDYQLLRSTENALGYVNDVNSKLGFWVSSYAKTDGGSNLSFIEVQFPSDTEFTADGLKYLINDDKVSVTVTYPTETAPSTTVANTYTGDIVVPNTVTNDGFTYSVTAIGGSAFCRSTITSIVIGDNVTETGYDCCAYNAKLTKAVFGSGVTKVNQGFGYSCANLKDVTIKAATPPTGANYLFSAKPTIKVKASSVAAYKAATYWSSYSYAGSADGFDFTYDELQTVISDYTGKYAESNAPGYATAESLKTFNDAVEAAGDVAADASTEDISAAVKAIIDAEAALEVNPIECGQIYYVVTAGNGTGYSGGPYNYENKAAIYNADGYVSWKAWDKTDKSQMYRFSTDDSGKWYMYNVADNTYLNKGTANYGCQVTTSAEATTAQTFTLMGGFNGKYAFTGATNVYAMSASHNGSSAESGTLNVWGNANEAKTYGVNQWYLVPVDSAIAAPIEAKATLTEYYNEVVANYAKMCDATYDDAALTAEQKTALSDKISACKSLLDATDTSTEVYVTMMESLSEVYEKAPFIEGGRTSSAMAVTDIKDGSKIILQDGPNGYTDKFMVAYPDNANGNAVKCDDADKFTVWQLEATGSNDAIYTSKPTYYMKDLASGKYFGATDNTTIVETNKRMVDGTTSAYAFCFLTKAEIDAQESGRSMNVYSCENPVFVHHSNSDNTWFRLSRFGGYGQVYYISSTVYPTNNDWQAWNLLSGESNYTISEELEDVLAKYGDISFPNTGSDPGCFDSTLVTPFNNAIAKAKALTAANTRQEYRAAIDSVKSTYAIAKTAVVNPIVEGYYYIESAWSEKAGQNIVAYDPNDESNVLANHANTNSAYDIFHLTIVGDGQYQLQNVGSKLYVGQAQDNNSVTLVESPADGVYQVLTYDADGQYKWRDNKTTFTYYITNNSIGRYYGQSTSGFDAWYLRTVPQDIIDEILTPTVVSYYEIASEPSTPVAGKTYVLKSVANKLYATANGAESTAFPLDSRAIWSIQPTATTVDTDTPTYYLKSEANDGYWQIDDFVTGTTEGSPKDGFDVYNYKGLNATFGTTDNAQKFTILPATAYSETETRSSVGSGKTPTGYVIATTEKVTSGTFSKYYKFDTQGSDVALTPWLADVDWQFYEAVKGTDIYRELEIAQETYSIDTESASTSTDPGFYNADKIAAYSTAMAAAKALTTDAKKSEVRKAIDALAAAYADAIVVNPITEGYYTIVSAGAGSGYPYSDEEKYNDEDKFAMYNSDGVVKWKTYDESLYEEIYYVSPATNGNWNVKNLVDNTYINKGTGSYNCNVETSADATTEQVITASNIVGKFTMKSTSGNNVYALTASHNGSKDKTEANLNIWGSVSEANKYKMNLWYFHKVSDATVKAAEESIASSLSDLIAEYNAIEIPTSEYPGLIPAAAVESFKTAIAEAQKVAESGTTEEKIAASNTLKAAYQTCITSANPMVSGKYYVVCDNSKIAAAGKDLKAMYIDADAKTVRWAKLTQYDSKFVFDITVNDDGTYYFKNVGTGLYAGSATAFCGTVAASTDPVGLTMHCYDGTGSYYIKGGIVDESNGWRWTYCPKGNAAGTADGPNDVWAYNGEGTAGGDVAHAEWTWCFLPYTEATGGVWEIASEASAPEPGKTYVMKSVANSLYATTKGGETKVNVLDDSAIWSIEATGNTVDTNTPTYYLKSEGNEGHYWQIDDFVTGAKEGEPYDGFDVHGYKGLNANFSGFDYAQPFTILPATAYSADETRSSVGNGKTPTGYVIATAEKVTSGTFAKFYKLDTQGSDVALTPWQADVDWQFYEATFNNNLSAELAAAIEAYDFDTESAATGTDPGFYNADNFAAYTAAMTTAKSLSTTLGASNDDLRLAIDALAEAYAKATTVNPIVEGYYTIVSAGKGSGYPFSDAETYDDEDKFAMYNADGKVSWKVYDEGAYDEIYYLSPAVDGNWSVKNLVDNTYINKGAGSYNCNVLTSADSCAAQVFTPSVVAGKYIMNSTAGVYAYALTASHNGSKEGTEGTLNIWGSASEANKGKMNLWYLHKVSDATVEAAKESVAEGLSDLIAEIEAKNLEGSDNPGYYSKANVEALNSALTAAKALTEATADQKMAAVNELKTAYNTAISELNPITDGYYYIVSKYEAYKTNFGGPAAMYVAQADTLASGLPAVRFETFDKNNANFIFELTAKEGVEGGFYAKNIYNNMMYLNTGDGDTWYGEITNASAQPTNAQIFKNYGVGQFWVADETDTRVSRCVRKTGVRNGTVYGWTTIGDAVADADKGFNSWELIPLTYAEANAIMEAQKTKDAEAEDACDALVDYVASIEDTYESYISDESELSDGIKDSLKAAYKKFTESQEALPYDITSTKDDYNNIKTELEECMEAAKKEVSGVEGIVAGNGASIAACQGGVSVTAAEDMTLTVVSANGAVVARQNLKAGETATVALTPGIYVVNGNKVLVK